MSANKCFAYRYPGDRGEANPSQEPAQCPDLSDFARENKIRPQSNSHPTVSPAYRGGFQTDLCTRPQRAAYRRLNGGNARKCSEMSGNIEISAPNHHSRTRRNQRPQMSGYARKKQNPAPGPPATKPCPSHVMAGSNPPYKVPANSQPSACIEAMLGNERK